MSDPDSSGQADGARQRIPTGVERTLRRAADDPAFLERLEQHRAQAARDAGIELTAIEATLLDTIDASRIAQMVANLPPTAPPSPPPGPAPVPAGIRPDFDPTRGSRDDLPGPSMAAHGIRPDMVPTHDVIRGSRTGVKVAVATGVVLAAGAGALLCVTAGNRPDLPPPSASAKEETDSADAGADADTDADGHDR